LGVTISDYGISAEDCRRRRRFRGCSGCGPDTALFALKGMDMEMILILSKKHYKEKHILYPLYHNKKVVKIRLN